MEERTVKILEATLRADATIAPADRNRILKIARGETAAPAPIGRNEPRIYSRAEAGKLLGGRTTRFVDSLAKRGLLQKFIAPGNRRAIGITARSLNQFLGA